MLIRRWLLWAAWLCCWGTAAQAGAQSDADVERLTPATDGHGFIGMSGTRTPGPWGVDVMLWQHYSHGALRLRLPDGSERELVRHRWASSVSAQLGLGGRLALSVALPVVLDQRGSSLFGGELRQRGVGDPRIALRARVWGDPVTRYGVKDGGAIALQATYHAPLGAQDGFFAADAHRVDGTINADVQAFGLSVGGALGYRLHAPAVAVGSTTLEHLIHFGVGLKVPVPLIALAKPGKVKEAFIVEVQGSTDPADFFAHDTTPLEGRLAYRVAAGDFHVTAGAGAGFVYAAGTPAVRGMLAVGWSPRVKDHDADGVPDDADECEHLAEDKDGFEDEDGCPEPDNDQDMVLDEDDLCPDEAAEEFRDEDEDGCTDPAVDNDKDGVLDHEDDCPEFPEDKDGFEDGDGCPEEGPAPPATESGQGELPPATQEAPADPQAAPADPQAAPADPQAAPADPQAAPADPQAAPADPQSAPAPDKDPSDTPSP